MNEFNIKVSFKDGTIISPTINLVQNDINSTVFKFDFDDKIETNKKIFQMKLVGDDDFIWIKEIRNNEIVLVDSDNEDGEAKPIITKSGSYKFDIALYNDSGKLTTTETSCFYVRPQLINISQEDIDDGILQILDDLIKDNSDLSRRVKELEDIDYLVIE